MASPRAKTATVLACIARRSPPRNSVAPSPSRATALVAVLHSPWKSPCSRTVKRSAFASKPICPHHRPGPRRSPIPAVGAGFPAGAPPVIPQKHTAIPGPSRADQPRSGHPTPAPPARKGSNPVISTFLIVAWKLAFPGSKLVRARPGGKHEHFRHRCPNPAAFPLKKVTGLRPRKPVRRSSDYSQLPFNWNQPPWLVPMK